MRTSLKKIVVTGGSRGLGRALALRFSAIGHEVFIVGRNEDQLRLVQELEPKIQYLAADVSDKDQIYKISGAIGGGLGHPDFVVQCAGYLGMSPLKLLVDSPCEDFEKVLDTNLLGPFRLTKALFPMMVANGGGTFVNISSDAAIHNYETWGTYSASKAAMDRMTGIFHEESKGFQINHLALDPGEMATDMYFAADPDRDPATLQKPEDVAEAMVDFLLKGNFQQSRYSREEWQNAIKGDAS